VRRDALAVITYDVLTEIATLLGSTRPWPRVPHLTNDWIEDLQRLHRQDAEPETDDEDEED
jgi:hypothetical protein